MANERYYEIVFGHAESDDRIVGLHPIFGTCDLQLAAEMYVKLKTSVMELLKWNNEKINEFHFNLFDMDKSHMSERYITFMECNVPLRDYIKLALDNKFKQIKAEFGIKENSDA